MSFKYSKVIFTRLIVARFTLLITWLAIILLLCVNCEDIDEQQQQQQHDDDGDDDQDHIKTIVFKDEHGVEHEEYAFREPARGLPGNVINMFCSSIKLRLYWNVYRQEVKENLRKGLYMRRMARLARHIFEEVRDADKPFNETMLSQVDEYFSANKKTMDAEDKKLDKAIEDRGTNANDGESDSDSDDDNGDDAGNTSDGSISDTGESKNNNNNKFKNFKAKLSRKLSASKNKLRGAGGVDANLKETMEEIDSSETIKELESQGQGEASKKLKAFAKSWGPKVALAIYTRWRTMWWMMMSCLFTKYYLWDPALEEFTKLQRGLVMWPELQVVRMQDLKCKPLMLFRRLMDICKILNPLMRFDFGQFNLDKTTRFKSDSS